MAQNKLTPELLEKIKACTTAEEVAALAKTEGFELDDEQLNAIAGGISQESLISLLGTKFCVM